MTMRGLSTWAAARRTPARAETVSVVQPARACSTYILSDFDADGLHRSTPHATRIAAVDARQTADNGRHRRSSLLPTTTLRSTVCVPIISEGESATALRGTHPVALNA